MRQPDIVGTEQPAERITDPERPDDLITHDERHGKNGTVPRLDHVLSSVGGQHDAGVGEKVCDDHGLTALKGQRDRPRTLGKHEARPKCRSVRARTSDDHQIAGRTVHAIQR